MTLAALVLVALVVARAVPRVAVGRAAHERVRSLHPRPIGDSEVAGAPDRLAAALEAAAVPWLASRVRRGWAICAVLSFVVALVAGPVAGIVLAVAATGGPALALWIRRDAAVQQLDAGLPAALDAIARALRSGVPVAAALAAASSAVTGALAVDLARVAAGAPVVGPARALEAWARDRARPSVRLGVAALVLGLESGGSHARAVEGVAATIRARLALAAEVRALSSQARTSAVVIAAAPLGFMAIAGATDPRVGAVLFRTRLGAVLLTLGLALDVAGALWMVAICRGAEGRGRRIRHTPADSGLAEVIDLFAVALSAGLTVRLAVEAVASRAAGAVVAHLQGVLAECAAGRRLADALDDLPARAGEDVRPLAAALAASERYGSPLAPVLERLATEVRERHRRRAEEMARRVPVRLLFPLVCCVLPAFGLLTIGPVLAGAVSSLGL